MASTVPRTGATASTATLPSASHPTKGDNMKQQRTSVPGIYRRQGKYVVRYRVGGKRYAETVSTMTEARRVKRERERAKDRGESELDAQGRKPFAEFASVWI